MYEFLNELLEAYQKDYLDKTHDDFLEDAQPKNHHISEFGGTLIVISGAALGILEILFEKKWKNIEESVEDVSEGTFVEFSRESH